jgi:drug/metabolite transporter, DME family
VEKLLSMYLVHSLALTGALFSASATICTRLGLPGHDAYTASWINLVVGTIGLWGAVCLVPPQETLHARGVLFFILAGLIGTVGGRLFRSVGIEKVGASVAAAITNLNPFISTGLAILLLGERVTLSIVAGTSIIVLGTIVLSSSGRHVGFHPRHLVYPFLSATCFGVVAILRKLGLSQTGPLLGYTINVTAALIAFSAFLLVSGNRRAMVCKGRSLWYFIAAGVAENAGVFLILIALNLGTVSIVAPLYGAAPLFVLLMSFVFLKDVETLSGRVILGIVLLVLGVYLLIV